MIIPLAYAVLVLMLIQIWLVPFMRLIFVKIGDFAIQEKIDLNVGFWSELRIIPIVIIKVLCIVLSFFLWWERVL